MMKRPTSLGLMLLVVMSLTALGGCASVGVKVWQRDLLSREDMQFDNRANDRSIDDHVYFSKEASSGGRGFGGGGCGCN